MRVAAAISNSAGLHNQDWGGHVYVCTGLRHPWGAMWPMLRAITADSAMMPRSGDEQEVDEFLEVGGPLRMAVTRVLPGAVRSVIGVSFGWVRCSSGGR